MARIVVASYAVRFPVGGYLSWVLQWLIGFQRLGHDVYFVEKSGWSESCYDPSKHIMTDDCSYGTAALQALLARFDLGDRWCFVDARGRYHGMSRRRVEKVFSSADLFVDTETHGTWLEDASHSRLRVLVEGDPAYTQIKWHNCLEAGEGLLDYDYYYTVGRNIGTGRSMVPTAGKPWRPIFHPVHVDLFPARPVDTGAPFTTVMSWQVFDPIEFDGVTYGQKDIEFIKFMDLPRRTKSPLEIAVGGGENVPTRRLLKAGWRLRNPLEVTVSFDSFRDYIAASRGEFSVAKNVYVATNSGWFSERSAAYLASGRPVVLQDTGFSAHLPCGHGLFAVRTVDEAAAAIEAINSDYQGHSRWARDLALEFLDTRKVLTRFLKELSI
jgi:hypothetical protein